MAITNGTDEAIQLLVNTFIEPGDEVVILTPSYAMYRFYCEVAGARIVEVPYGDAASWDLSFNLPRLLEGITPATKAVFLSNPNNPTGTAIGVDDIETVLKAASNACIFVDEAYFDFYGQTVLPLIGAYDNLFVSRTFSKAYGMAALRLGCFFSRAGNVAALRKAQSPYSVNMLAALAARVAIQDQDFVRKYVAETLEGRRTIERVLAEAGVRYWPSEANFVLFDGGDRSDECLARCREAGVLIRDRRHEIRGGLRVTAGPPGRQTAFLDIVRQLYSRTSQA
jgi:histidinol-phosphate aminotransferase